MTHPGGAGLGGAPVRRKMFIPWSYWTAASLLFWLESHLASGRPGRVHPEVQSPKYLVYATRSVVQRIAGKEGAVLRKRWLDWTGRRRQVGEEALNGEAEVSQVLAPAPAGELEQCCFLSLLPIVAVVEIKSDGSWKVLRTLVSQVRCQYLPTGLLGESGTLS